MKVAVVGATGVVGRAIIRCLETRQFPAQIIPLASERSANQAIQIGNTQVPVQVLTEKSFNTIDIALFSAGSAVSEQYAPIAVQAGAVVIDNTAFFRQHPDVPLIVPEVNAHVIKTHTGIIANPNCSTAQLVLALKPIHDAYHIKRIVIATYQSVSGAGKDAMTALTADTTALLQSKPVSTQSIAFNIVPHIDKFLDTGYTKEEMKMINEIRKLLDAPTMRITATCARVPVMIGHSEAVTIETETPVDPTAVHALLKTAPGIRVWDPPHYPTPRDCAGQDAVGIGRIRRDFSVDNGIALWCVGDNLLKGAALNAVQIAECL